jgi:hypothetical protein
VRGAAALGVVVVAGHLAGSLALAHRDVTDLAVTLAAPTSRDGTATLAAIVDDDDGTPPGPGLHRRRWSVAYRGGFSRSVGAAALVGPFQDPAARACTGRVLIGQRLLDDGHAGPGTVAATLTAALDDNLRGQGFFPIGDYQGTRAVALAWSRLADHPDDRAMFGEAPPAGYLRVAVTVAFAHLELPIVVALTPEVAGDALHLRVDARAELAFGNRALQWVSDKLGADRLATRLARGQLDRLLITTLAPPPPFALPGGATLRFLYCDGPIEITAAGAALPFAVELGRVDHAPTILPPRLGPGPRPPVDAATTVALDLDLDALNALLFELWRAGALDQRLAEAGLDRRFNADPTVREFLSVRLAPVRLALPPVVVATPRGLRLSAAATVAIRDGDASTTGRIWGGLDLAFAAAPGATLATTVDLGALELSCERTPTTLVPCYGDLVDALRGRGGELHGALTEAFTSLLAAIFVDRRVGVDGAPADLVVHGATPRLFTAGANATLRLDLAATLAAPR